MSWHGYGYMINVPAYTPEDICKFLDILNNPPTTWEKELTQRELDAINVLTIELYMTGDIKHNPHELCATLRRASKEYPEHIAYVLDELYRAITGPLEDIKAMMDDVFLRPYIAWRLSTGK